MAWVAPVYDRTLVDALTAKANQASATELKGALNPSDLNRIEGNVQYVVDQLSSVYNIDITLSGSVKTDWSYTDIPYITAVIDKIRNFVLDIEDQWFEWQGTMLEITLAKRDLNYDDINAIEEHLYYLNQMLTLVAQYYKYNLSGNSFYSGQDQTYL